MWPEGASSTSFLRALSKGGILDAVRPALVADSDIREREIATPDASAQMPRGGIAHLSQLERRHPKLQSGLLT